eukprot:CCRYP_011651-RB/>CCRYP_011651-RB protein AED:0.47 eAED:0.67 QI:0/0/0/1/0/0/3/0/104
MHEGDGEVGVREGEGFFGHGSEGGDCSGGDSTQVCASSTLRIQSLGEISSVVAAAAERRITRLNKKATNKNRHHPEEKAVATLLCRCYTSYFEEHSRETSNHLI